MHLITVSVQLADLPSRPVEVTDGGTVVDILWTAVIPADRIEHISAHESATHLRIGIYSLAANDGDAEQAVRQLFDRVTRTSPRFRVNVSAIDFESGYAH
jgi:hypothetical protein